MQEEERKKLTEKKDSRDTVSRMHRSAERRFRFLPGDAVILAGIVLFCAFFLLGMFFLQKHDEDREKYVRITSEGAVVLNRPMKEFTETFQYKIRTGKGEVVISISSEEVRFEESDCEDKICMKQGALKKIGDGAVCLPNRVVVQIVAGEEGRNAGMGVVETRSGFKDDSGQTPDAVAK